MPIGVGPATWKTGSVRHRFASAWLLVTTCAHFRPARLNAFDAEVTVTVCVGRGVRHGRVRHVPVPGIHERRVHLVGDDSRAVTIDDLGQRGELVAVEHAPGRIVRVAQQHGAGAVLERGVDRVEVERSRPAVGDQRHRDDFASAQRR